MTAIWTLPRTWVAAEKPPAATLNTHIRDNLDALRAGLIEQPCCRVTRTAVLSIPDASLTAVNFTAERFDTDTMHDNTTNNTRITFTQAGVYTVGFHGSLDNGTDYTRLFAVLRKGGATEIARSTNGNGSSSSGAMIDVSTVYKFAAAEYVEVLILQDNSANVARDLLQVDDRTPEFYACRVALG